MSQAQRGTPGAFGGKTVRKNPFRGVCVATPMDRETGRLYYGDEKRMHRYATPVNEPVKPKLPVPPEHIAIKKLVKNS